MLHDDVDTLRLSWLTNHIAVALSLLDSGGSVEQASAHKEPKHFSVLDVCRQHVLCNGWQDLH